MLYITFNSCCALLTSPFLPGVETAGFSLLMDFPERTENYLHPFRKFLTDQKEVADRAGYIVAHLCHHRPVVIILLWKFFFSCGAGPNIRGQAERPLSAPEPVQYNPGFRCRKKLAGPPSGRSRPVNAISYWQEQHPRSRCENRCRPTYRPS